MGFQSQILRFRKRRRAKDRSNPLGLIGFLLAAVVSLLLSGGVIYGINRYANITRDLPSPTELEFLLDPLTGALLEPTLILDRSGKHVLWRFENPTIETRRYTPITAGDSILSNQVPDHLIWATLAAVDPD